MGMKSFLGTALFGAAIFLISPGGAQAQSTPQPATQTNPTPEEIIRKFAAKEAEFRKARENYTYRQIVKMEELEPDGHASGSWEITSDIIFGPDKKRTEKVIYAPPVTLQHISLDPQDEQDLRDVQPFVLTTEDVSKYDIQYLGKQQVDEIPCYSFSVKPKKMAKGERYFQGTIWVDDRDFQIVKTYGKGVGIASKDHQFPNFETYREQIDGKYWFPTYTRADDVLHFPNFSQHIRMVVRYQNYKRFGADTSITYGDAVSDTAPKK